MTRRPLAFAPLPLRPHPFRTGLALPADQRLFDGPEAGNDLRLFLTAWLGGLVFFGTYLA